MGVKRCLGEKRRGIWLKSRAVGKQLFFTISLTFRNTFILHAYSYMTSCISLHRPLQISVYKSKTTYAHTFLLVIEATLQFSSSSASASGPSTSSTAQAGTSYHTFLDGIPPPTPSMPIASFKASSTILTNFAMSSRCSALLPPKTRTASDL